MLHMVWNEIKTAFENEILCPALRGRVRFEYTDYDYDNNQENSLAIYCDKKLIYKFETRDYTEQYALMCGQLRETIQDVLSQNYLSRSAAVDATWEVTREFMPWLTSQKGIMRAEDAVRQMKKFIESDEPRSFGSSNQFTEMLWFLSKHLSGGALLESAEGVMLAYAKEWYFPFIKLRIKAERDWASGRNK